MRDGESWDSLPKDLLTDLAQLTKANSIEGNKKDNISVIYTPWANLKKDGSMDVGQVSFHDAKKVRSAGGGGASWRGLTSKKVKRILVPQRENPIVNRLNKTKVEKKPDLKQDKEDRLRELRLREQASQQKRVSSSA
jgi:coiled-coil domain-containing protein 25